MTPEERLAEDVSDNGSYYRKVLVDNPSALLLLQPTPPRARARCYARRCIFEREPGSGPITDDFRIILDVKKYFHVDCLERMLDLASLALTRFKLDELSNRLEPILWGLILR